MIARLEQSGMANHQPEVRALLERSRALLHPPRRWPRRLLDAGRKRMLQSGGNLSEGARWVGYHLAWGWDWLAEAFSPAAHARLRARGHARQVMRAWRAHRQALPIPASLETVHRFLAAAYGAAGEAAFRAATARLTQDAPWTLRGGAGQGNGGERLAALRWSALIRGFEPVMGAVPIVPVAPPPQGPATPQDSAIAQTAARRMQERETDLRDQIRRKRQDISAAFAWKLKTDAEAEQRDAHVAQLRGEIAALEQQIAVQRA